MVFVSTWSFSHRVQRLGVKKKHPLMRFGFQIALCNMQKLPMRLKNSPYPGSHFRLTIDPESVFSEKVLRKDRGRERKGGKGAKSGKERQIGLKKRIADLKSSKNIRIETPRHITHTRTFSYDSQTSV